MLSGNKIIALYCFAHSRLAQKMTSGFETNETVSTLEFKDEEKVENSISDIKKYLESRGYQKHINF